MRMHSEQMRVFNYTFISFMAAKPQATAPQPELARDLRVSHATAIVVGTIIGSGIFLVPAAMMQAGCAAKLLYLAWCVGGLLSSVLVLIVADLGSTTCQ